LEVIAHITVTMRNIARCLSALVLLQGWSESPPLAAAFYPKDLFADGFSTYWNESEALEHHVEGELDAGRAVILRIIASPT
jgi:hypothetical protein